MNLILEKGHSRIPVYYEQPTNIIGVILVLYGPYISAFLVDIADSYMSYFWISIGFTILLCVMMSSNTAELVGFRTAVIKVGIGGKNELGNLLFPKRRMFSE